MRATLQKVFLSASILFCALDCLGQSNVYSLSIYAGGVSYRPGWVAGSPPHCFGLEEYSYWKDSAGYIVMWAGNRSRGIQPGDKHRTHTQVLLGPVSFSVPLPRLAVAIVGATFVAVLGFVLLVGIGRARSRHEHESLKV